MRNHLILALLLFCSITAIAQPISKKGEPYLPAAGDWAVGIDASPFLKYFGNFFTQGQNQAPYADFTNQYYAVTAKKFTKDDFAYRVSGRFGILADNQRAFSTEFSNSPTNTTVEDKYRRAFTNLFLSAGIEQRKGNTRVQGFYGVEGNVGFGTEKHAFTYGNAITAQNTNPVRTEWEVQFQNDPTELTTITESGGFITEINQGTMFALGARAFLGAEFFIFPKWSVGFEYGFGMGFRYQGNGMVISEQWTVPTGGNSEQFVTSITDQGGSSSFGIDSDVSGGAIFMFFYF